LPDEKAFGCDFLLSLNVNQGFRGFVFLDYLGGENTIFPALIKK
jgi:hypothetical protein